MLVYYKFHYDHIPYELGIMSSELQIIPFILLYMMSFDTFFFEILTISMTIGYLHFKSQLIIPSSKSADCLNFQSQLTLKVQEARSSHLKIGLEMYISDSVHWPVWRRQL